MFDFYVNSKYITTKKADRLVSGNVNTTQAVFSFSDTWQALVKTVVFKAGSVVIELLLDSSGVVQVPWEVLQNPNKELYVGVYGLQGEDIVLRTSWASMGFIDEGVGDGIEHTDPTPDVYQQLVNLGAYAQQAVGSLEELATTNKDSLVGSINEVYSDINDSPASRIMDSGGGNSIMLYSSANISLVDYFKTINKRGLYTIYLAKRCPDNPVWSEKISSSLRGIGHLTLTATENGNQYVWFLLFDQEGTMYSRYCGSTDSGWIKYNGTTSIE